MCSTPDWIHRTADASVRFFPPLSACRPLCAQQRIPLPVAPGPPGRSSQERFVLDRERGMVAETRGLVDVGCPRSARDPCGRDLVVTHSKNLHSRRVEHLVNESAVVRDSLLQGGTRITPTEPQL